MTSAGCALMVMILMNVALWAFVVGMVWELRRTQKEIREIDDRLEDRRRD